MSIEGSECPVSKLVNSDACPRPTTGHYRALIKEERARLAAGGRLADPATRLRGFMAAGGKLDEERARQAAGGSEPEPLPAVGVDVKVIQAPLSLLYERLSI